MSPVPLWQNPYLAQTLQAMQAGPDAYARAVEATGRANAEAAIAHGQAAQQIGQGLGNFGQQVANIPLIQQANQERAMRTQLLAGQVQEQQRHLAALDLVDKAVRQPGGQDQIMQSLAPYPEAQNLFAKHMSEINDSQAKTEEAQAKAEQAEQGYMTDFATRVKNLGFAPVATQLELSKADVSPMGQRPSMQAKLAPFKEGLKQAQTPDAVKAMFDPILAPVYQKEQQIETERRLKESEIAKNAAEAKKAGEGGASEVNIELGATAIGPDGKPLQGTPIYMRSGPWKDQWTLPDPQTGLPRPVAPGTTIQKAPAPAESGSAARYVDVALQMYKDQHNGQPPPPAVEQAITDKALAHFKTLAPGADLAEAIRQQTLESGRLRIQEAQERIKMAPTAELKAKLQAELDELNRVQKIRQNTTASEPIWTRAKNYILGNKQEIPPVGANPKDPLGILGP